MILGHLGDAIAAYGMWAFFTIVIPGFILFKLSKIFIRSAKRIPKRITRAFKTKDVSRVKRWAQKNYAIPLDFEQAAAVGSSAEKNILTVARAGSGKTRVLTTRALWLIDNCKIEPSQILLLAFNNTAVAEIEKRLQKNLGNEKIPHVMTFHALATAIVKPTEELLVDDKIGRQSSLSKKVASILHSNDLKESLWKFQSARFRADFSKIQESEIEENDELEVSTNDKGIILEGDLTSLDGTFVKSRGEQAISNVLFQNDIKYEYEKNFGWDGSSYRPDFTVSTGPDSGLIIEYFGLVKDPDYRNQIEEKRKKFLKNNITFTTTHKGKKVRINGKILTKQPQERLKIKIRK